MTSCIKIPRPIKYDIFKDNYYCPTCRNTIYDYNTKFCAECGQAIAWGPADIYGFLECEHCPYAVLDYSGIEVVPRDCKANGNCHEVEIEILNREEYEFDSN